MVNQCTNFFSISTAQNVKQRAEGMWFGYTLTQMKTTLQIFNTDHMSEVRITSLEYSLSAKPRHLSFFNLLKLRL